MVLIQAERRTQKRWCTAAEEAVRSLNVRRRYPGDDITSTHHKNARSPFATYAVRLQKKTKTTMVELVREPSTAQRSHAYKEAARTSPSPERRSGRQMPRYVVYAS